MNTSNKINVDCSSLVGLKAELLRKQAEAREAKAKNETIRQNVTPKAQSSKNGPKKQLKLPKEPVDIDDLKIHQKSRLMLEAKSRMYENMQKLKSNENPLFLVDFTSKDEDDDKGRYFCKHWECNDYNNNENNKC